MTALSVDQVADRDDRTCSVAPYERQPRSAPVPSNDGQEGGDEPIAAALVGRVLRLQHEIAGLAGAAADTEQQLALVYRRLARQKPARSTVYLAAAQEANRFAARKREEQHRWQLTLQS
ncbi:hypothetical protein ACWKSP_33525 [Micromonosporaceae bacterium Da 78-11]